MGDISKYVFDVSTCFSRSEMATRRCLRLPSKLFKKGCRSLSRLKNFGNMKVDDKRLRNVFAGGLESHNLEKGSFKVLCSLFKQTM